MNTGYYESIRAILSDIHSTQADVIDRAAELITSVLLDGGNFYLYGTGSHSTVMVAEATFRAGGLMVANPIFDPHAVWPRRNTKGNLLERLQGYAPVLLEYADARSGDVLVVVSNTGNRVLPVDMALEAKKRGITVIALTSIRYSSQLPARHRSGRRLYEVADVVLDNRCPPGDAAVEIPGLEAKVGATSTIAGAFIINALAMQVACRLLERGVTPPVFKSSHLPDAPEWNRKYLDEWKDRIKYL